MNRPNYNKKFELTLKKIGNSRPSLLLHVCCAPCLSSCLEKILNKFDLTLFFCNDNITDKEEFSKRFNEVKRLVSIVNNGLFEVVPQTPVKLLCIEQNSNNFFDISAGLEGEKEGGVRCHQCFKMRLFACARFAKANGFDFFSTTLTVSQHKNSNVLNEIGLLAQSTFDVEFLCSDFKKNDGYTGSVRLSNKYSIYRQSFCGCPFSNLQ